MGNKCINAQNLKLRKMRLNIIDKQWRVIKQRFTSMNIRFLFMTFGIMTDNILCIVMALENHFAQKMFLVTILPVSHSDSAQHPTGFPRSHHKWFARTSDTYKDDQRGVRTTPLPPGGGG